MVSHIFFSFVVLLCHSFMHITLCGVMQIQRAFCIESKVPKCIFLYFVNVDCNRWLKSRMSLREKLNDGCMVARRRVRLLTSAFSLPTCSDRVAQRKFANMFCQLSLSNYSTSLPTCNSRDEHIRGLNCSAGIISEQTGGLL